MPIHGVPPLRLLAANTARAALSDDTLPIDLGEYLPDLLVDAVSYSDVKLLPDIRRAWGIYIGIIQYRSGRENSNQPIESHFKDLLYDLCKTLPELARRWGEAYPAYGNLGLRELHKDLGLCLDQMVSMMGRWPEIKEPTTMDTTYSATAKDTALRLAARELAQAWTHHS